ncbi:MAG TPA: hypothetical protein VF526_13800, partial [Solirubrobacteraceae bacterium]
MRPQVMERALAAADSHTNRRRETTLMSPAGEMPRDRTDPGLRVGFDRPGLGAADADLHAPRLRVG